MSHVSREYPRARVCFGVRVLATCEFLPKLFIHRNVRGCVKGARSSAIPLRAEKAQPRIGCALSLRAEESAIKNCSKQQLTDLLGDGHAVLVRIAVRFAPACELSHRRDGQPRGLGIDDLPLNLVGQASINIASRRALEQAEQFCEISFVNTWKERVVHSSLRWRILKQIEVNENNVLSQWILSLPVIDSW